MQSGTRSVATRVKPPPQWHRAILTVTADDEGVLHTAVAELGVGVGPGRPLEPAPWRSRQDLEGRISRAGHADGQRKRHAGAARCWRCRCLGISFGIEHERPADRQSAGDHPVTLTHDSRASATPLTSGRWAFTRAAAGGVAAQATYALSNFVLQFAAARLLGLDGLGRYSALYAFTILATAISGGFVGDSLTVLDRADRSIRAGLQAWLTIIAVATSSIAGFVFWSIGFVNAATALAFGVATAAFLVEDALRRSLMALFRFWRVAVVDLSGLAASVSVIVATWRISGRLTLAHLMVALLVGQVCATLIAISLLPSHERIVVAMRGAAMRTVAAYGGWRAVQQLVRPALLAAVRVLCLLVSSVAAVGALEAARVYTAPAMLVVGGLNSYLFATYARTRDRPLESMVRRVDRTVLVLIAIVGSFGLVAVVAIPVLGPVLSGGEYDLSVAAVASWSLFAASVAAVTPFGQLASVRGEQRAVLMWRTADSVATVAVVAAGLALGLSIMWVPLVLAIGSISGGLAIRMLVLRPRTSRYNRAP